MCRNIGADHDRFKMAKKGGHYSNSTAQNNGFKVKKQLVVKAVNQENFIPIGRPLWQIELGKETPAPSKYNLKRTFDDAMVIKNPASCMFGASYNELKKVSKMINFDISFNQNHRFFNLLIFLFRNAN